MNVMELLRSYEERYGLPAGYLSRTRSIESRDGQNTFNPKSGAAGDFQFIPSTAKQYGLANPYDLNQAADAAGRFTRDNMQYLQSKLGRAPTAGELYLAHQQGAGGAVKLLTNPDTPAGQLVGQKAVAWNGGDPNAPALQFANKWVSKFDGGKTPSDTTPSSVTPDTMNVPDYMRPPTEQDTPNAFTVSRDDLKGLLEGFDPEPRAMPKTPDETTQMPTLTPNQPGVAAAAMLTEMLKPRRVRGLL